jgi:hydrocephalus-inducing protein
VLVGLAEEPEIYFDKSHINFSAILAGKKMQETLYLINNEEQPFSFQLERSSLAFEEKIIEINPSKAIVAPMSKLPVTITFNPTLEKKYNFNLSFLVKRKTHPLTLNVKGEGYIIHDTVMVESEESQV